MNVIAKITRPKDVEVTVEMTLTLERWKAMMSAFGDQKHSYPACDLVDAIREVVYKVESEFVAEGARANTEGG